MNIRAIWDVSICRVPDPTSSANGHDCNYHGIVMLTGRFGSANTSVSSVTHPLDARSADDHPVRGLFATRSAPGCTPYPPTGELLELSPPPAAEAPQGRGIACRSRRRSAAG